MKPREWGEVIGNGSMYVLSTIQTKEIFEIISLVLSILISIVIIVSKLITWYKAAKKDGKITKDEINDASKIIQDGVEDIKDKLDKEDKR